MYVLFRFTISGLKHERHAVGGNAYMYSAKIFGWNKKYIFTTNIGKRIFCYWNSLLDDN